MGKYKVRVNPLAERPWELHPIWRAFGCLMLITGIPLAFVVAHFLVELDLERGWYPIPGDLRGGFTIPIIDYYLPHILATLIMTAVVIILGAASITFIYALIYAVVGPKRYGPLDAPPIRGSRKKKR